MGFIAMKGLSGGLLTNSAAIYAYMAQFENVLPIWGVQKESELDEFLSYIGNPPELTDELKAVIEKTRKSWQVNSAGAAATVCRVRQESRSTTVRVCPCFCAVLRQRDTSPRRDRRR